MAGPTQAQFGWSRPSRLRESGAGRIICGHLSIGEDEHGLPVLRVIVDGVADYSGVIDHRTLMRLMSALSAHALKPR